MFKKTEIFSLLTELRGRQLRAYMEAALYRVLWVKFAWFLYLQAMTLILMVPKEFLANTMSIQVARRVGKNR